jgi:hypothetical protein
MIWNFKEHNSRARYTQGYTLPPALLLVFLATSYPALEILCQSDVPFWKIPVPGNNASPGWIAATSGRPAVAVVVAAAAAVAVADVVDITVAAALVAQRNVNGDFFVR